MSLNRRCFLLWSFTVGLLGQSQRLLATVVSPASPDNQFLDAEQSRCLQAWIDTLLPADEVSPAASELGVAARVADNARGNPDFLKLIRTGCRWLDQQARTQDKQAFAQLEAPERERVVRLAEQATAKSLPRVFFERTREYAFLFYYAQPQTWAMLDYPGPPQPLGFTDHTSPPPG
ncbi:MAG: gluconate 2-dehydrogenase subunit 3 family protein [Gammaproteobacteria bacterium]